MFDDLNSFIRKRVTVKSNNLISLITEVGVIIIIIIIIIILLLL